MLDGNGRTIEYLRISVTDRCNLRCQYCMPQDGLQLTSHREILRFDEISRVCQAAATLGFRKIKLTGGEPLVRLGIADLIRELKAIDGIESVSLTTNGVLLQEQLPNLTQAGLDAVNISLDTLDARLYHEITRVGVLEQVKEGIRATLDYPQLDTKINCVPMGLTDQNPWELAEIARRYPIHVRYIEMMPIGLGKNHHGQSQEEMMQEIEQRYGKLLPYDKRLGNGPCTYYEIEDFCGKIGFISAISHKFCGSCNRVRLTSQGFLKTCLQFEEGGDLKSLLRQGATTEAIAAKMDEIIRKKPLCHQFEQKKIQNENRLNMSQIGG